MIGLKDAHRRLVTAVTVIASVMLGADTATALSTAAADAGPVRGSTSRVSISSTGAQGDGASSPAKTSEHGRFVVFVSSASNLVPGDTNDKDDVFVRDRATGTTQRVSVSSSEAQGNGTSVNAAISAHGRYVAFSSLASNLVPGDEADTQDVFVRDRHLGTTRRVSVSSTGAAGNAYSWQVAISPHGRYVAFESGASNLVPGDTNNVTDVFVRDRRAGTTSRVSVSSRESQAGWPSTSTSISARGRYVSFLSYAPNLVPGDTNEASDVFVRDRWKGTTRRVSVGSGEEQGNDFAEFAAVSKWGRYVTFSSRASNLVHGDTNDRADVFVRDRRKGTTRRVSLSSREEQGDDRSERPSISANGRYVAFDSLATNLVPADTNDRQDVFVRDRWRGTTRRVSVDSSGAQADAESSVPWISSNGRFVGFDSYATNLVPGDTNATIDSFVRTGPRPHRHQ